MVNLLLEYKEIIGITVGFLLGLFAFNYQQYRQRYVEKKDALLAFHKEIMLNKLNAHMAMDSDTFLKPLDLSCWHRIKNNANIPLRKSAVKYVTFIELANEAIDDYLQFKRYYTGDYQNRSPDNQASLHAKRERAISAVRDAQGVIDEASADN